MLKSVPTIYQLRSKNKVIRPFSGEELWVLVIGRITDENEPLRPHVKYVGNMHGDEVTRHFRCIFVRFMESLNAHIQYSCRDALSDRARRKKF